MIITYDSQGLTNKLYTTIDSEWPGMMIYVSPQLEQTQAIFPRKNLETREPPLSWLKVNVILYFGFKWFGKHEIMLYNLYNIRP